MREFFRTERQANITIQAIARLVMATYILWMKPMNLRIWLAVVTIPFTHWPRRSLNQSDEAQNTQKILAPR